MLILHRGLYQSFGQQQRLIVIAEPRCRHRLLHDIRQHFHTGLAFAGRVLPENPAEFLLQLPEFGSGEFGGFFPSQSRSATRTRCANP